MGMPNKNRMKINNFTTKDEATAGAGEKLHQLLMGNKDKPVLLLLSGGSALTILDYVSKQGTGEHLTIAMVDERFSMDKDINNFSQFQKTDFYTFALEMETSFFGSVPRKDETKEMLATRLENNIKNWKTENTSGVIFACLGMGADGHTAGIFPIVDENKFNTLFNSEPWITSYTTPEDNVCRERVTATIPLLKEVDIAIVFACGQDKKQKFEFVTKKLGTTNLLPALVWHEMKNVEVFTDIV